MKKISKYLVIAAAALPGIAYSQSQLSGTSGLIDSIGRLVARLSIIAAGVALLVFFWGIVKYISSGADDAKVAGKRLMIWGTVALFVMVSIWGIINFIWFELGLNPFNWTPDFNEIVPNN